MMQKEANIILENTISHLKQIKNLTLDIEKMINSQLVNEKIVETTKLFSSNSSIPEIYFNELRYQQLNIIYPNLLWSSLFLTTFASFESCLDLLSDYFFNIKNLNISPQDLKDRGIQRSRKYLVKMVGLEFPQITIEWQSIVKVAVIRNCIIHANGNVIQSTNTEEINSIVNQYSEIKIANDHIIISKDFINLFTSWCEQILLAIQLHN